MEREHPAIAELNSVSWMNGVQILPDWLACPGQESGRRSGRRVSLSNRRVVVWSLRGTTDVASSVMSVPEALRVRSSPVQEEPPSEELEALPVDRPHTAFVIAHTNGRTVPAARRLAPDHLVVLY